LTGSNSRQRRFKVSPPGYLFKLARYLNPSRAVELNFCADNLQHFHNFKIYQAGLFSIAQLAEELPEYLASARDTCISPEMDLLLFWRNRKTSLPNFTKLFAFLFLLQPSSAACEMVFSVLTRKMSDQPEASLQDYVETAVLLEYINKNL
jgi:hypothetical protein